MELNVINLAQTLSATLERDAQAKLAENQLKAWAADPQYYLYLQSIYLDITIPVQVRWLSIIEFKNGIEKYWRLSKKVVIPDGIKKQITGNVFELVNESNSQLMIQNAHAIARIARVDFPTKWPNLFNQIEHLLQESFTERNLTKCFNVLTILNQVVKNLGQVRIGKAKISMQSKVPSLTPLLINIYTTFFKEWTSDVSFEDTSIIDLDYLTLKVLRRVLVDGYQAPHTEEIVHEFFKISLNNFESLLAFYKQAESNGNNAFVVAKIEKFLKCQTKLYYNFVHVHQNSFVLLHSFDKIIMTLLSILQNQASDIYNNTSDDNEDLWSTLAIKSFLILKKVLSLNKSGETTLIKAHISRPDLQIAKTKFEKILNNDTILTLTDLIINWYLRLRPADLENWNDSPEEFINEELSESWEYQVRPCAENFFQYLIVSYKELLVPFVLDKISETNEKISASGNDLQLILLKDSIFAIIQLSGIAIADMVDFDSFLVNVLLPSLSIDADQNEKQFMELKILKRRTCLIINEWISIKCSRENRVKIYQLLLSFLDSNDKINNDKVLQLSTAQTLKNVIEEWDFNKQDFAPYSSQFIEKLLNLLNQMELTESKVFILNSLNSILERNGPYVQKDVLDSLLEAYPNIWTYFESSEENLLIKTILIRILKNLIVCFQDSKHTSDISLHIIDSCCTCGSDYYNVLSEDGFELWEAFLKFYPNYIKRDDALESLIFSKFELLIEPLINTTEILPLILSIIRSYLILIPVDVILSSDDLKQALFKIFASLAPNISMLRDDSLDAVLSILDIFFVKVYSSYTFSNFDNTSNDALIFYELMKESGVIKSLIEIVADDENNSILTINKVILIVSRFFFGNANLVVKMIYEIFSNGAEQIFKTFLNNWLINSKNVFDARKRKQNLLGISSLFCIRNHGFKSIVFIPENINLIFSMWSLHLDEINENSKGDCDAYYRNFNYYEFDLEFTAINEEQAERFDVGATLEYGRYEHYLVHYDPIHLLGLKYYIKILLEHLEISLGDTNYKQMLSVVDQGTLEHLQMRIQ